MSLVALTRAVPAMLGHCQLTHVPRVPIDVTIARRQHASYERLLAALGCRVVHAPAADELPDSVFVEDLAVVLERGAIMTRPGAASRRPEAAGVEGVLAAYRPVTHVVEPATVDGGDVLRCGRILYVGIGGRTNEEGARQLREWAAPRGYGVRTTRVGDCLHLKSAACEAAPGLVLVNPAWVDAAVFEGCRILEIDPAEPFAANVLRVNGCVVCAASHERTAARLRAEGLNVQTIDVSELAKAEGALTCCSLLFEA